MQQLLIIVLSIVNILGILIHFLIPVASIAAVINESVMVTNVTEAAFSVSWMSDEAVGGVVNYGTSAGDLDKTQGDDRGDNFVGLTHHVTVGLAQPLSASTTYFFQIMSDSVMVLDSQGQPFAVNTGAVLDNNQVPALLFGKVLKEGSFDVANDSVIYLVAKKPNGQSSKLSTFGGAGWVMALNNLRDVTGARMFTSDTDGILQLNVNGSIEGRGKLEVAGDTVGLLNDISLDKTPPVLGTAQAFTDSTKTQAIDVVNWQHAPSPYFEWLDAIDAGYGTRGYYVYFGLDSEADPKTASGKVFQTATGFDVAANSMISGKSYYLLVKTVDNVDNVSATNKVITYRFDNRAPNATLEVVGGDLLASAAVRVNVGGSDDGTVADQLNISYSVDGGEFSQFTKSSEINLIGLSEGGHNLVVLIRDLAGNVGEVSTKFTVDLTGPQISALAVSSVTTNQAIITWQTNEPATSQVKYGAIENNLDKQTELDSIPSTFHGESLSGLSPDTAYFFEVLSSDRAGNTGSARGEFKTLPTPVSPTPTPKPTPTPEISPVPLASATPVPDESPIPIPTPTLPAQSPSPEPLPTPAPSASPTPVPQLKVDSFSPTASRVGKVVTVEGLGFGDTRGSVKFGGIEASNISSWSSSKIEVAVSADSQSGKIMVVTASGETALSSKSFKVLKARLNNVRRLTSVSLFARIASILGFSKIAGVTPEAFLVGEQVIVGGEDLGDGAGSRLTFDQKESQILAWNETEIKAIIPEIDPNEKTKIQAILPDERSNELEIKVGWPNLTVEKIHRLFAYNDRETEIEVEGKGFLMTANNLLKIKVGNQIVETRVHQDKKSLTFKVSKGLPLGEYSLVVSRGDGIEAPIIVKLLVTKAGDFWKPGASSSDDQVRDGKVTIEDLSRFLTNFWQKTDAASIDEGDVNFGLGDVSKGKVDIYDLNKIMANWD